MQCDLVRPPWVVSSDATDRCLRDRGHVAGYVVHSDGDVLRVGAKSRTCQRDDCTAWPCGKFVVMTMSGKGY